MRDRWVSYVADVNKELLLIFSIIASVGLLDLFIGGQRIILMFYVLPCMVAAYYFGRSLAIKAAIVSILFVTWLQITNPTVFGRQMIAGEALLTWSDMAIWAGLLMICAYVAGSLHEIARRRLSELQATYSGLLQILSQVLSSDKYTQNHSYRVSVYAVQIASEMGFDEDRIEDIRAAALLHDIGKLELSRDVLYKAARLTNDEMQEMKTHVDKGIEMLTPVAGSLRRILPIILAHHEKMDGSGYHHFGPEEIPIESRVLSVADAYDALVSDRPYRKAVSTFEARDIIIKSEGTDFDPKVVSAFDRAFKKQRLEVPEVLV